MSTITRRQVVTGAAAGTAIALLSGTDARAATLIHRLAPINNSYDGVLHAGKPPTDRTVWLTFDDGGTWTQVDRLLRTLAATNVRGTFFPTGQWAAANQSLIRRMKAEGHLVGNHSWSHPDLLRLSSTSVANQIRWADQWIVPNTWPKLFRCPYGNGAFTARINSLLSARGYHDCYWTCDTADWSGVSANTIIKRAVWGDRTSPRANARGVVLMHMSGRNTGAALPGVIAGLRRRGLVLPRRV